MKGVSSTPGDYIYFKSQVPLHKIPIGTKQWRYYDFGPKVVPPLICLTGTAGTADVYYKQIMSLSMKGYRVISVDIPRVWSHHEWIQAFEKFLDTIDVHHVHLYGTSLGGFLAQLFCQYRPRRVKSLVLSNSFLETNKFASAMPWAPIVEITKLPMGSPPMGSPMINSFSRQTTKQTVNGVGWTPSFLLKRHVLSGIREGPHEPFIADSVDFVVSQVETLKKDDLASRLTLMADVASVGPLLLADTNITIIDTNDYCATPQELKDQVMERYPGARRALLKTGGDFPFLSRSDEVNLHLQLHLRRVGVDGRQDLVPGVSKDASGSGGGSGGGGSSSGQNDGGNGGNDAPKDTTGNSEALPPESQSQSPNSENSADSHLSDDGQLRSISMMSGTLFHKQLELIVVASTLLLHMVCNLHLANASLGTSKIESDSSLKIVQVVV